MKPQKTHRECQTRVNMKSSITTTILLIFSSQNRFKNTVRCPHLGSRGGRDIRSGAPWLAITAGPPGSGGGEGGARQSGGQTGVPRWRACPQQPALQLPLRPCDRKLRSDVQMYELVHPATRCAAALPALQ